MPFEIRLKKDPGHVFETNRKWVDFVLSKNLGFSEVVTDHVAEASNLSEDAGLSTDEWIERGIGVIISKEMDGFWIELSFWEESAIIEAPNFPEIGISRAVDEIQTVVWLLEGLGFLLDRECFETNISIDTSVWIGSAYRRRQKTVTKLAEEIGGKPC